MKSLNDTLLTANSAKRGGGGNKAQSKGFAPAHFLLVATVRLLISFDAPQPSLTIIKNTTQSDLKIK